MSEPTESASAHGEDADDLRARREAMTAAAIKSAHKALRALASDHGGSGSVALANMGRSGVRLVFVATDGTFGDAIVPTVAAAEQVCADGGWEITGWDMATSRRIAPGPADRRRMAGTGR